MDALEELFPGVGRGGKKRRTNTVPLDCRELTREDLVSLTEDQGVRPPAVKRIRHSHHFAAKLLADGRKPGLVALMTGYGLATISILQNDPAFRELVEYYKSNVEEVYFNAHERLAALGFASLDELQHRLEEDPESFSRRELMELATTTLDRAGHGPKATVQHNHGVAIFDAESLKRVKEEAEARRLGAVREVSEDSLGAIDSVPASGRPVSSVQGREGEGSESGRAGVRAQVPALAQAAGE